VSVASAGVGPDAAIQVDLPRVQSGSNPQHLLLGLLNDYWFGKPELLPSAALVRLLEEFGITPASARAAINRLARRGVLVASKRGRQTFYGLHPDAAQTLAQTQRRAAEFGVTDRAWDGTWTTVVFSLPDEQHDVRYVVRSRLRWLGFAPFYDGVWVSPGADEAQTIELLEQIGSVRATILRSSVAYSTDGGDPLSAWDLEAVRQRYVDYIERFTPVLQRVRGGRVDIAEALIVRTRAKEFWWRELISIDPELPQDLLPAGWPGKQGRQIFAEIYDSLGPLAELRVRQLFAEYDEALAAQVTHLTTSSLRSPA
jgi:phenylacetic acid degradation operon negative regulatory protein